MHVECSTYIAYALPRKNVGSRTKILTLRRYYPNASRVLEVAHDIAIVAVAKVIERWQIERLSDEAHGAIS